MRAMASLTTSLAASKALELFRNIEMPLLFTTADLAFHGIPINNNFFMTLKSDIEDRLQVIEHYFKCTQGADFSVSSPKDKKKLPDKLLSAYRNILNQKLKEMRMYDFNENSEKYLFYMKCLEEAPKRLEKHPLILLGKEHGFFLRSVLPFCEEVIKSTKFLGRIRSYIDTIGTETGRLIVTDPPLQQVIRYLLLMFAIIIKRRFYIL
jgi:hypothetical protein